MIESTAAVLYGPGEPLKVEKITYSDPGPMEVVVRISATSICHSDVHKINNGAPHLPMVVGHEAAGVVESVGAAVSDLSIGQKVGLSFVPSCGECRPCRRGVQVACVRGSALGSDGRTLDNEFKARTSAGEKAGQMVRLGALSERTIVHRDSLAPLPEATDLQAAALMSCGFVTGAGAVLNDAQTRAGDDVLIVGAGGVGIAAIQAAKVANASRILVVDISEEKLRTAKSFGATHVFDGHSDTWVEDVVELTDGFGVDQAISCVGTLSDDNVASVLACVREAGIAVLVGAGNATINLSTMGRKTVIRTLLGSHDPKSDQLRFLKMYEDGLFKLKEMVSATYPLSAVNDAVGDLVDGRNIRGLITFSEGAK